MTVQQPPPRQVRDSLDDSWFDKPGRTLRREDLPTLPPPPPDDGRDHSVELDDPWFKDDGWR